MRTFKCIGCGATKESDKKCNCMECGYGMFEAPYERAELLRKEIRDFIARLRIEKCHKGLFEIYRNASKGKNQEKNSRILKSEDDQRFPDYKKIQAYVCSAAKTEQFFARLQTSLEQIEKHIHTPYAQEYVLSFDPMIKRMSELDAVLTEALKEVGVHAELSQACFGDVRLSYSETPVPALLSMADKLIEDLGKISEKIKKFIKQNNIYGTAYQRNAKSLYKASKDKDYASELQKCADQLKKILEKKYMVDIFSDGTDELNEMLCSLWTAVETLMSVPILEKNFVYTIDNDEVVIGDQIFIMLSQKIVQRYSTVDDAIYAYDFLEEKTEDELFDIYNKMIELDTFDFMGVTKSGLMKVGESEKKLEALIGLAGIKNSIKKIKAYAMANRGSEELNIHMCFLGNPGTGKTEVARYIAGILYENKILPTKKVVEVDRSGLVSQYFGATAEKTQRVILEAMGGVLFVDEAYALGNNSDAGITDYGKEAIDTLVKAMEDYRGKFCVIFAGYKNEMLKMLSANPGFQSRIQFMLDFPNYSREELASILSLMLAKRQYTISETALNRILDITDIKRKEPNFANARELRNILDQVIMCQNIRCAGLEDKEIGIADVHQYVSDAKINLPTAGSGAERKILTGEEELEQLIGLDAVKRMVKKIKAYAKRNKGEESFNLHMCFYGNPGTGKTEVARIISRILYDAGVLEEAKLVETDGQGLLGKYVGETAPKTEAKIHEAMHGVLFIDEAYSLAGTDAVSGGSTNYGDEAIAVLLKEMEDQRGSFCVILAGYKDEMQAMLSKNPGFTSRIQFTLDFPDYTREELKEISQIFLRKKRYTMLSEAMERMLDITDYFRNRPNFANARTVRNVLDQVIMNQNLRTEDADDDRTIVLSDVEDYIADERIDLTSASGGSARIGFV